MVLIIKKGTSKKKISESLQKLAKQRKSGVDTSKYLGILKSRVDPIAYQKEIRNEWR